MGSRIGDDSEDSINSSSGSLSSSISSLNSMDSSAMVPRSVAKNAGGLLIMPPWPAFL